MQLNLIFPGTSQPHAQVWEALDEATRRAVIERLAELIANAARVKHQSEGNDHD